MVLGGRKGGRKTFRRRKFRRASAPVGVTEVRTIVKSMAETKFLDTNIISTAIPATGIVFEVSPIAQGDGVTNRDGNRVHIKSLALNLEIIGADSTQAFRYCILMDRKPRGTTNPVIADMFEDTGTNLHISHLRWNRRFLYLLNVMESFSATGKDAAAKMHTIKVDKLMAFDSGTTGDYSKNSIWFVAISDSGAVSHPGIRANFRLKFKDL